MDLRDILKFVNFIYHEYKAKMQVVFSKIYILYCFDKALTSGKPNIMTFSITSSQIFFANFVIFVKNEQKTAYRFIVHNTSMSTSCKR